MNTSGVHKLRTLTTSNTSTKNDTFYCNSSKNNINIQNVMDQKMQPKLEDKTLYEDSNKENQCQTTSFFITKKNSPPNCLPQQRRLFSGISRNRNSNGNQLCEVQKRTTVHQKQTSIRSFGKITQNVFAAEKIQRIPFGELSNKTLQDNFHSPKSRLEIFDAQPKEKIVLKKKIKRQSIREQAASTTDNQLKKNKINNPKNSKIDERSRHYLNAVSKNVLNHVDISKIPLKARALHRVHSASILETNLQSTKESFDYSELYSLNTVKNPQVQNSAFASISGNTLKDLLNEMSTNDFQKKFILIDCRYPYEFKGGHIQNAINMYDPENVTTFFFPKNRDEFFAVNSKIPIFYCEYSQKRGPKMAMELRRQDRIRNENRYPNIDYREIYILDRGYRKFSNIDKHWEFCTPKGYVPMDHEAYKNDLKGYKFHKRQLLSTDARPILQRMVSIDNIKVVLNLAQKQQIIHCLNKNESENTSVSSAFSSTVEVFCVSNKVSEKNLNNNAILDKDEENLLQKNFSHMTVSSPGFINNDYRKRKHSEDSPTILNHTPDKKPRTPDSNSYFIFVKNKTETVIQARRSLFNWDHSPVSTISEESFISSNASAPSSRSWSPEVNVNSQEKL